MNKQTTEMLKKAKDLADHHEAQGNGGTALVIRELVRALEEGGEGR